MSNEGCMNQMIMCVNAIKRAIQCDYERANNPRKRKDGIDYWSAAAYSFNRINNSNVVLTGHQVRELYNNCASYLE